MSSNIPLLILPLPDGTQFKSDTLEISKPIYDKNDVKKHYNHIGKYIVTSSSFPDKNHLPYNVFNNDNSTWKSNYTGNDFRFKGSTQSYKQDPYTNLTIGPSVYQGGGLPETFYVTIVENMPYNGEWLQVQIPEGEYPIYLFRYTISTPKRKDGISSFPKTFLLVGSVDGSTWEYIDMHTLALTQKKNVTEMTFDINSLNYYYYYRFIFVDFFPECSIVEINKISMYGFLDQTPNLNAVREGFDNYNHPVNYSDFKISNQLNEFIKPSTNQLLIGSNNYESDIKVLDINDVSGKENMNNYISVILTILASSLIYLTLVKK
jgi:hypothetical protein